MSASNHNDQVRSVAKWPLTTLGEVHGKVVHARRSAVLAKHFAELLPKGHSVLDVGCGDGLIDSLVLEHRRDLTINGVDVLVRPHARISVTHYDGRDLHFPDAAFDTVLFSDILHHTESPPAILKDAVRVARQCVVIKDHLVKGWLARATLRFMDFVGNAPHGVVLPYNYFTPPQWADVLQECRLVARTVRNNLGRYPPWGDVFFGRSLHFVGIYDIVRR